LLFLKNLIHSNHRPEEFPVIRCTGNLSGSDLDKRDKYNPNKTSLRQQGQKRALKGVLGQETIDPFLTAGGGGYPAEKYGVVT
jgi:hypothetical protein